MYISNILSTFSKNLSTFLNILSTLSKFLFQIAKISSSLSLIFCQLILIFCQLSLEKLFLILWRFSDLDIFSQGLKDKFTNNLLKKRKRVEACGVLYNLKILYESSARNNLDLIRHMWTVIGKLWVQDLSCNIFTEQISYSCSEKIFFRISKVDR